MATTPSFAATPRCAVAQVSTANTNRDGTGTIATVFTAGASGSRIENIKIVATGSTTNNVIRLYIHDGTNTRLFDEVMTYASIPAVTTTVLVQEVALANPIILPNGYSLRASTNNAETYNIFVMGGDF